MRLKFREKKSLLYTQYNFSAGQRVLEIRAHNDVTHHNSYVVFNADISELFYPFQNGRRAGKSFVHVGVNGLL